MATKSHKGKNGKMISGVILVVLGVLFLLNNYGYTMFDFSRLWPIFLIIPGIGMLLNYENK